MEIKYETNSSNWGVRGFFEGQRLVFSAVQEPPLTFKKKWLKFLPFFSNTNKSQSMVGSLDIYTVFSKDAKKAWTAATALAKKQRMEMGVEDIFLGLLKEAPIKNLLLRINANSLAAESLLKNYLKLTASSDPASAKKIPFEAFALSAKLHNRKVDSLMLLGALLKTTPRDNILQAIFSNIGLTLEKLEIFSVWDLGLNFNFKENSSPAQILYCLNQAKNLEEHFGYFFEFSAVEAAVKVSSIQTFKDMRHLKALEYLVKAGLVAKEKRSKVINKDLVAQAIF